MQNRIPLSKTASGIQRCRALNEMLSACRQFFPYTRSIYPSGGSFLDVPRGFLRVRHFVKYHSLNSISLYKVAGVYNLCGESNLK